MLKRLKHPYYYGTEVIEEQGNMFCAYCLKEAEHELEHDGCREYFKIYFCNCEQAKKEEEIKLLIDKEVKQYNLVIDKLLKQKEENIKQLQHHWDEIKKERISIIKELSKKL